ncbi:hypothetical protein [Noviherbaspirillum sp.]|uniref:hypothetical protein n=1 Tax=Noviherbaspirillum sp. TaxID=1926288 RepID=UPI0025CD3F01|nr:hypothetical protein [Noviherbaspirillum sp.]
MTNATTNETDTPSIQRPLASAFRRLGVAALVAAALAGGATSAGATNGPALFEMVRSPGIVNAGCLPNARATVTILPQGPVEVMSVLVRGLPPRTEFDFFVIQVPNAPFGLSWYQGDIETDANGNGHATFIGRFNEETFIVAPGVAPAPSVHNNAFPDATSNPQSGPVHTYHLGMWFNSPQDAAAAGCPSAVTPFNGEHNAGVQVLNTSQFPDAAGPLLKVKP